MVVLVGIHPDDDSEAIRWLSEKIVGLRIFDDTDGHMNLGIRDIGGAILVISQFTLYGDCRKGRRPSFQTAASPTIAEPLYEQFVSAIRNQGIPVETGRFGADMQVELINDGPVTLILDSPNLGG